MGLGVSRISAPGRLPGGGSVRETVRAVCVLVLGACGVLWLANGAGAVVGDAPDPRGPQSRLPVVGELSAEEAGVEGLPAFPLREPEPAVPKSPSAPESASSYAGTPAAGGGPGLEASAGPESPSTADEGSAPDAQAPKPSVGAPTDGAARDPGPARPVHARAGAHQAEPDEDARRADPSPAAGEDEPRARPRGRGALVGEVIGACVLSSSPGASPSVPLASLGGAMPVDDARGPSRPCRLADEEVPELLYASDVIAPG